MQLDSVMWYGKAESFFPRQISPDSSAPCEMCSNLDVEMGACVTGGDEDPSIPAIFMFTSGYKSADPSQSFNTIHINPLYIGLY